MQAVTVPLTVGRRGGDTDLAGGPAGGSPARRPRRLEEELAALKSSSAEQVAGLEGRLAAAQEQLAAARAQLDATAAGAAGDKEAFSAAASAAQAEQQRLAAAFSKTEGDLAETRTQLKSAMVRLGARLAG